MNNTIIMDKNAVRRAIIRLSHEVTERNGRLDDVVIIGIRRGGEVIAQRIGKYLKSQGEGDVPCVGIDIRNYRDDVKKKGLAGEAFGFPIDGKRVVLCDDVIQTGRSVRAAIEGLFAVGRPKEVQLLVLADRGGREVPVRADFVGKNVFAARDERVEVALEELGAEEDKLYLTKLG